MLRVPRVIRFATWAGEVLAGREDPARMATALTESQNEPHRLAGVAAAVGGDVDPSVAVAGLLAALAARGATGVRAVLPEPGDVAGLPGPADFNVLACDLGQAAVSTGTTGPALGVLPRVEGYGSALEPGELVTWEVHEVQGRPHLDLADLTEADRQLRLGLLSATRLLTELDVARWRPEAAEVWADAAGDRLEESALPPGWPDRAVQVLTCALRLRAVTGLALDDDGGALSGWEADRRRSALRDLDRTARRAAAAAAGPFPPRR